MIAKKIKGTINNTFLMAKEYQTHQVREIT